MAYALSQEEGITLGNRNFLGESYEAGFTEVPVSELMNAGYEETMAYTTVDMNDRKKSFVDYVLNEYKDKEAAVRD